MEVAASKDVASRGEDFFDFKAVSFEPATILVVDDIDYNRDLLRGFYNGYGLEIIEAGNGREAIEQARLHQPDLILLDMKMPEMDGYEALAILHQDPSLKHIPVVAVTASALKQDEEHISKICNGYLRKPVKKVDLIRETMKYLPHTVTEKEAREDVPVKKPILTEEKIAERIAGLPVELAEQLGRATVLGEMETLRELAARVSHLDVPLAEVLGKYIAEYKFKDLRRLFEQKDILEEEL